MLVSSFLCCLFAEVFHAYVRGGVPQRGGGEKENGAKRINAAAGCLIMLLFEE